MDRIDNWDPIYDSPQYVFSVYIWFFIYSGVHVHSGGVGFAQFHQTGSNRNYRILKGTCRLPGG
jgi:hypothetical protein